MSDRESPSDARSQPGQGSLTQANHQVGTSFGWACPRCGSFVPRGCFHSCPTTAFPPYPPPAPATSLDPTPTYMRIAAALERLATAFERFVEHREARGDE